jgi:hypothetical protein
VPINAVVSLTLVRTKTPVTSVEATQSLWTFSQPTTQPTEYDALYDFRVVWQSPRFSKLSFRGPPARETPRKSLRGTLAKARSGEVDTTMDK